MFDLIRQRRSIRRFTKDPLSPGHLQLLQEALLRAPSSRGTRPWEFLFVDDPGLLAQLAGCKPHGAAFLEEASLGIVVCGDEKKSDVWVEDCAIAAIFAQLAATSLGLGSCWIQVRNRPRTGGESAEEFIRRLLAVPAHLRVASILALGHPAEKKEGHPAASLDFAKIHRNRYGRRPGGGGGIPAGR